MLWIIVVFYTAGICWAEISDLPTRMVQFSSLLLTSSLFIFCKIKQKPNLIVTRSLLGLLFFLLGLLQYNQFQSNQPADPHHIYNLIKTKQTVSIKGFLQEYPVVVNKSSGPQTRLLVKIKGFYQAGNHVLPLEHFRKASGLVLITLNGLLPENLVPGDTFLAKTTLSRVHTYSTPGSFNYKKHLAYRSIFIKGWIHTPQNIIKLHSLTPSSPLSVLANLIYLPERIRNNLAAFLNKTLSQPARGLYKAILIGDRGDVPPSVLNNFTKAGCLHILAISGMHMGLLALISIATIFWLLKRSTWLLLHAPVLKISVSLAFLPLFIYALIAGLNIPVLRALLMTTIFILAILFDRPGNLLNHILLAAFFVLLWKPWAIFSVSFQLSFSAVITIALIYPLIYRFLSHEFQSYSAIFTTTAATAGNPPVNLKHKIFRMIFKWFLAGFSLTTAATLGTFPLLLFHFNRFSLVAPISNLLVEPLICFWSLIIGLAACLCIPILPTLGETLFIVGSMGVTTAERICAFFSALPYSSIWLPTPTPLEITTFYFFLLSPVIAFNLKGRQRYCFYILALFFLFFGFAVPAMTTAARKTPASASVTFLDVGHGSSILLRLPENKNILIDGGGAQDDRFNIGERVIGPFLWKQKIKHLDDVVITHPHADHYNGLPFILARFHPKKLWINGTNGNDREYRELLNLANQLGVETKIVKTNDFLYQSGNTRLLCIHSGREAPFPTLNHNQPQTTNLNDQSIVLRLEISASTFLFPGDISAAMAEMLVKKRRQLKADVLMAPHHGSTSSVSREFIQAVAPEFIVVSAGRNSTFHLPAISLYNLQEKGIKILSTNRDGTITFSVKKAGNRQIGVSSYQVN